MQHVHVDILGTFLQDAGLPSGDEVLARFDAYLALIVQANRRMNLIGKLDERAIVEELFCDSLQLAALGCPLAAPIVDVGSGAGFPGIPLKLVFPALALVLVEPREKRFQFLGHVVRSLHLEGVERVRGRIEEVTTAPAGLACAKAFTTVERWLPIAAGLIAPAGAIGVLCSQRDWEQLQIDALPYTVAAQRAYRWGDGPERIAALVSPS